MSRATIDEYFAEITHDVAKRSTYASRVTLDEYFMEVAHAVAKRSTCIDKQVGCVLVDKNNKIIATGYNGNPSGLANCSDRGECVKDTLGAMCFAVHAEMNAMLQCDTRLIHKCYCTLEPCHICTKMLLNTPCLEVIYGKETNNNKSGYDLWHMLDRGLWRKG